MWEAIDRELRLHDPNMYPAELRSEDGHHHLLFPSFFHTLCQIENENVSLVIRTFGTDSQKVADALNAFASGLHPDFPGVHPKYEVKTEDIWRGRYSHSSGGEFRIMRVHEGGSEVLLDEVSRKSIFESAPLHFAR